jgi:hypothetical protein
MGHPMRWLTRWPVVTILAAAVVLLSGGCRPAPATVPPSIVFTTVPEAAEGGSDRLAPIAGRVEGARPGQQIVIYARSGTWWVQPLTVQPFTAIDADRTWTNTIHLGTEYAALLVDPGYQPLSTVDALPKPGGAVSAVATTRGVGDVAARAPKTVTFSGYDWELRQTPSDRGGANDYDAANVRVDEDGFLHLKLTQRDGYWLSSEVSLTRSLGYGTYVFVVRDTSQLDPAAALGLLTWDDAGADQNHRELDIEISRWGNADIKDAQYVVQPYYVPANVVRFAAPAGRATHSFRWEPGRALFRTTRETGAANGAVVAQREFTSGVPVPGNESVHMNLYYFRYAPGPPRKDVEVIIEKFQYLP